MKKLAMLLILLIWCNANTQENEQLSILEADSTWAKEIIKFPIDWAPKMTLTGFEELRFHKDWSNKENDGFWSLVIAWSIKADAPLNVKTIELNFDAYFDGLMKPNHWSSDFPDPNVLFIKNETDNEVYIGKMRLFDGFHTGNVIDINIVAQQHFCKSQKISIIIFKLSPQEIDHSIWETLDTIKLKSGACDI
ncbi:hypothetical protein [Winogradskyella pulchriflava]|uniref:Uncharacterized protein n=1 Tax=Winogradskyella pulchriflava TaxID=1110688 RepID=A0ABV6QAH0_9FLAO